MRAFLILTIAALVHARPEAGYTYNAPQSGGNFLSGGSSGFTSGGSSGGYSQGGPSGGSSGGYIQGGPSSFGGGNSFSSTGFGGNSGGFGSNSAGFGDSSSSSFSSSSSGFQQQAPLIQKHIYVHVAPEEPEQQRPHAQFAASAPRKHYKIVFIKAPSAPSYAGAQLQLPQQDQEKTLIYVLVKRPEDQPQLNINAARPTTPSKPEVYFIRYKSQTGGGHADIGSSGGLSSGGISTGSNLGGLGSSGPGQSNIFSSGSGGSGGYTTGPSLSSGSGSSLSSLSGGSGPSSSYGAPASSGSGPY